MPPRSTVTTHVEPDYFQFYARRADAEWASNQVTKEGDQARLWSNGSFVVIGTSRKFGTTELAIELWDTSPNPPEAEWQHVVEVSLGPGGPLEVFSWDPDTPVVVVPFDEGWIRLRVLWAGLVAGRFQGMDEDGTSDEHLKMQAWSAPQSHPAIVRLWAGWPP